MYAVSNTVMSLNGVSNTVFPNTLNGLDSLDVTNITIDGQSLASLFVPYTAAQSNVDLNAKSLTGVNSLSASAVTASGLVQGQNVTATALTTTNTIRINSVPAGTTAKYLATNATGDVIEADITTKYLPYTGATSHVNLNAKNLSNVLTYSGTNVQVTSTETTSLLATGTTQLNTLRITGVGIGTQTQLLAVDATGNVINGTVSVPTTFDVTVITTPTDYYPIFVNGTTGGVRALQSDNGFQTISYNTGTRTLSTYQLKLLNVPAGTQTYILAVDSAGNVIQGTTPAPTQLLTTAIPAGSIPYYPTLISSQATGNKSYFNENSANTGNMSFQAPVLTTGLGTWYIPQLVINNAITLYNARFSATPSITPIGGVSYALGLNATNDVVAYVPSNQVAVTATTSNSDFNLLFTATGTSSSNITVNIDSGTNIKYNPATDRLTVPNLTVGTAATINDANLTGVPVAPSAAPGTNTTQIATTAFVTTAVASVSSNPNVTATSTNASYYPVFVDSLGTGVKNLYQDTVAADFNYNPSTNLLTVGNLAVNGTIGGANTMNLIQGGTSLMTLSTMNIFPQFPVISAYGGMGAVPAVAFDGNGGTGGRFLLKQSTTTLFPVGFGIDSGDEMWISNRTGSGFNFYNNGVRSATITSTGGLILGTGHPLGGLNINTQASTQSIRMGWSNLASMTNSGFYNIGIGYLQGRLVTSGYDNIMIGRESFPILTTGNNNIGIGFGNGTQITTGYYNIYIGTGASGSIGGATNTNEVVIGANTVGNGTNTVTLGGTDTTGLYLSAGSDTFYRASRTDHGIKLGSMFDFASAGGWDNSNALFVSTGGMGGNNYGIGMGYNSVAGVGQIVCLAPNVAWQPIRYKASSHQFYNTNASVVTINGTSVSSVIPYVASTGYPVCYFMPSTVGNNSSFIIADSFATYTSPATTFCRIFGTSGILFQDSNAGFQWRSVPLATPYASATQLMTLNASGLTVGTANTTTINNSGTVFTNTVQKFSGDYLTLTSKYLNLNCTSGGYTYFSSTATNEVWLAYSNGNYVGGMFSKTGGYFASNHLQVTNHVTTAGSTTNGAGVFIANGQNGYGFDFWTYGYGATGASTSVYVISNWSGSGVQMAAGSTSWGAYSDRRCKKNVCCIGDGHKHLMRLRPVQYKYLTDEKFFPDKTHRHGFVAQEFAEVYPQHVSYDNPPYKDVDGTEIEKPISIHMVEIIPDIVDSVQYLTFKAQRHKDRIIVLEHTIQTLVDHVARLTEAVNKLTKGK